MLVRVAKPMYVGGVRKEVGDVVDLPYVDAMGSIYRGRAEKVDEQAHAAPSGPMTTTSIAPPAEPEVVVGKKRKQKEQIDAV